MGMGLGFFSSSSLDNDHKTVYVSCSCSNNKPQVRDVNPKPNRWAFIRKKHIGDFLVVELQYSDCVNFEGRKILVFKGCSWNEILDRNGGLVDPHFSDSKKYIHPMARFEPTEDGYKMAIEFIEFLSKR